MSSCSPSFFDVFSSRSVYSLDSLKCCNLEVLLWVLVVGLNAISALDPAIPAEKVQSRYRLSFLDCRN
jgi:hypothetical protein